jgi:hypothetical protein
MAITRSNKRKDLTHNNTSSKPDATTSSDASAQLTHSVEHSPLFRLSPELRNSIYRLVLVRDIWDHNIDCVVVVDKTNGIPEPALLASNKTIRSEASGIFYHENYFRCDVVNFDPAPVLLLQAKVQKPFRQHPMGIDVEISGYQVNFQNLVSWVHKCHRGECEGLTMQLEIDQWDTQTGLLEVLFGVATKCPEMSSDTLQKVIETTRIALGAYEYAWLQQSIRDT